MVAVLSDNGYLLSRRADGEPASPTGPPVSAYGDVARAGHDAFADPVDQCAASSHTGVSRRTRLPR